MSPDLEFHLLHSRCHEMMKAAESSRLAAAPASDAVPAPGLLDRVRRRLWQPDIGRTAASAAKVPA